MAEHLCQISGLDKAFGENRVLRQLALDLPAGTVTAMMGANGAGKSTLVKILSGVYASDAGIIKLAGNNFAPTTPSQAIRNGVVTVHQAINDGVIPDLDVASNLMIDRLAEPGASFFLNRRKLFADAQKIADRMGIHVNVRQPVSQLGVADRQLIAIARAMSHEPSLLILDEPTSSLSATEAERLFGLVENFKARGVAVLYISHRMSDIRRIADRIVSMRDGEISGVFEGESLDYESAVDAMLGHRMTDVDIDIPERGDPILKAQALRLAPNGKAFDLTLHDNEVIAVTGLLGSGKTDLAKALFGLRKQSAGSITLDGQVFAPKSPAAAIARGVFMSTRDRSNSAVIVDFNITRNMTVPFLQRFSSLSFLAGGAERTTARDMIDALAIVCQTERDEIGTLSGGNQQKVMLARWLIETCRMLVLDEPFQGVDIQSRRDIGRKVRQTAMGRATLVLVSELDEALEIADRIVVMHEHAIIAEFPNRDIDINAILSAVTGTAQELPEQAAA